MDVEDALAEELKARVARLRRSVGATPVDKAEVAALEEGAEVLREILERRRALVAVLEEALGEDGKHGASRRLNLTDLPPPPSAP